MLSFRSAAGARRYGSAPPSNLTCADHLALPAAARSDGSLHYGSVPPAPFALKELHASALAQLAAHSALKDLLADQVNFTPATLENWGRTYALEGRLNCWAVLRSSVY